MKFKFHPLAHQDLNNSIDYYEDRSPGLGYEFSKDDYATIQRIIEFPAAWTLLVGNCRRCLTTKFPFGIVYKIKNSTIVIVAVMHLNREPNYWKD